MIKGKGKRFTFIMAHPRLMAAIGALVCLLFFKPTLNSSSVISRMDVAEQMGKILFAIERSSGHVSATYEHYPVGYADLPENISPEMKGIVSLGLMSGYPDHTFRPEEPMRLGELFTIWATFSRHLQALTNNSGFSTAISRYLKVPSSLRWMQDDLASLAGIGLISLPFPEDFFFDRQISDSDLRQLADATFEFFCHTQILTCTIGDLSSTDGARARNRPDGEALSGLTLVSIRKHAKSSPRDEQPGENDVWSYSTDQKTYTDSHPDDLLRIPYDPLEESQKIFSFRIPGYEPGTIELRKSLNRVLAYPLTPVPPGKQPLINSQNPMNRQVAEMPATEGTLPESVLHSGKVCNALTRSPLPGATLAVDGIVVTTDPKGEFQLPPLPKGSLKEFLITAEGYQSLSMKHRVGHKSTPLQFFLKPYKSSLKVQIISASTGKPVRGACARFGSKTFTSDASGRFESKTTLPGYHEVTLEATGYLPARELVFMEETPTNRLIKMQPQLNGGSEQESLLKSRKP